MAYNEYIVTLVFIADQVSQYDGVLYPKMFCLIVSPILIGPVYYISLNICVTCHVDPK